MDSSGSKAVWIALFANFSIFVTKILAAWLGNSAAMFSEALHSLADLVNSIFLLLGMKLASRPADLEHPFGYGKEVYFWSFIASIFMLGVTSMGSLTRGYHQLINPHPIQGFHIIVFALTAAILFELYAVRAATKAVLTELSQSAKGFRAVKISLRNINSITNPAVKFVFFEDLAALAGVVIALLAVFISYLTGSSIYDGLASLVIGLLLGALALVLAYENRDLIVGRAAHPRIVQSIGDIALSVEGVTDVKEVKTMYIGSNSLLVNMTIETKPLLDVEIADDVTAEVEKRIVSKLHVVKDINIEVIADDNFPDWEKTKKELN